MTVADLVETATAAGLDAEQIADVIAVHAPEMTARLREIMTRNIKIGQTVHIDESRYTVAAIPAPGNWDDAVTLVPYGTPLTLVDADLVRPLDEVVEPLAG